MEFSKEVLWNIVSYYIFYNFKYQLHRDADTNENEINHIDACYNSVNL